jgi:hypothetical protein
MDLSNCYLHQLGADESAKLEKMRLAMPSVCQRVRDESPASGALPKLTIWGVDLETPGDALDIVLLKYLRAEELNLEKAIDRVALTMIFRADVQIDDLIGAELPEHFKGHDFISGRDVEGRPVLISRFGGMDLPKVFGDTEAFVRYRAKVMEEAIKLLSFQKGEPEDLCQVHDYSGVPLNPGQEVKVCVNAISRIFGEHYPEFKGKTLFVNFPSVFSSLWKAFSIAIPERTRKKFDILPKGDAAALFAHIAPEVVPECLGGMYRESAQLDNTKACEVCVVSARDTAELRVCDVTEATSVAWELRVCYSDIAWEVVFAPADGASHIPVECSEPSQYLQADDGIKHGEFAAPCAGSLIIRFKNENAWFKTRLCVARAASL